MAKESQGGPLAAHPAPQSHEDGPSATERLFRDQLQSQVTHLQDEVKELQEDKKHLRSEKEQLQNLVRQLEKEKAELVGRVVRLSEDVVRLTKASEEASTVTKIGSASSSAGRSTHAEDPGPSSASSSYLRDEELRRYMEDVQAQAQIRHPQPDVPIPGPEHRPDGFVNGEGRSRIDSPSLRPLHPHPHPHQQLQYPDGPWPPYGVHEPIPEPQQQSGHGGFVHEPPPHMPRPMDYPPHGQDGRDVDQTRYSGPERPSFTERPPFGERTPLSVDAGPSEYNGPPRWPRLDGPSLEYHHRQANGGFTPGPHYKGADFRPPYPSQGPPPSSVQKKKAPYQPPPQQQLKQSFVPNGNAPGKKKKKKKPWVPNHGHVKNNGGPGSQLGNHSLDGPPAKKHKGGPS